MQYLLGPGLFPDRGRSILTFQRSGVLSTLLFALEEASPHRDFGWELLTALWSLEGAEIASQRR